MIGPWCTKYELKAFGGKKIHSILWSCLYRHDIKSLFYIVWHFQKINHKPKSSPFKPNHIDKINSIYFWDPLKQILYKGPIAAKIIILN